MSIFPRSTVVNVSHRAQCFFYTLGLYIWGTVRLRQNQGRIKLGISLKMQRKWSEMGIICKCIISDDIMKCIFCIFRFWPAKAPFGLMIRGVSCKVGIACDFDDFRFMNSFKIHPDMNSVIPCAFWYFRKILKSTFRFLRRVQSLSVQAADWNRWFFK